MEEVPFTKRPPITGGRTVITSSVLQQDSTMPISHMSGVSRSIDTSHLANDDDPPTGPPPIAGGPRKVTRSGAEFDSLATPTGAAVPTMAGTTSRGLLEDDASSSDENTLGHSTSSSLQVTPSKSKRLRFNGRTSTQSTVTSQTSSETSVLSCQLALLAALTAEMESSVNTFQKEQWKARFLQVNQVMQMVQWEANGLYKLADES